MRKTHEHLLTKLCNLSPLPACLARPRLAVGFAEANRIVCFAKRL